MKRTNKFRLALAALNTAMGLNVATPTRVQDNLDYQPAVFDRYTNAFIKIYFDIPEGRENEYARKVLITHLQSGNSYGIQLKEKHCKFPQPELGPWVDGSRTVGGDWQPPVLEGWEPPDH